MSSRIRVEGHGRARADVFTRVLDTDDVLGPSGVQAGQERTGALGGAVAGQPGARHACRGFGASASRPGLGKSPGPRAAGIYVPRLTSLVACTSDASFLGAPHP
ncbi:hypothetical protein H696_04449 [Fonticula alba]|uniref:Uncharacterized protein n=1 Tax=Fonticula alba TaxID=691883 RepID=A0A058Z463_FONAL|nr:hypothetical protein H696_04449 [Fonticula alba]KCV69030.1 hypothetical protein H696_04449 [Fonticula alba]|eukprot:XP_009496601.1 hypothetical protein H696_04449 [Fonticula alba]